MTTHIDTLKEWWSEAEEGVIEKGDTVINWFGGETTVYVAAERARRQNPHTRILARAPKPKPAWHDAVAVTADAGRIDGARRVFVQDYNGAWIDALNGHGYTAGNLRDVAPLIEAKVTDETARTVLDRYYETETGHDWPEDTIALMRLAVTAALGLEPA